MKAQTVAEYPNESDHQIYRTEDFSCKVKFGIVWRLKFILNITISQL
jgi:hypothetical protein